MHWYKFNIGDYAKSTRHLSPLEDLAYRRLIDLYYDKEKPLVDDVQKLARLINLRESCEEIKNVLDDFFILEDGHYHKSRIDEELANYHVNADKARSNGKLGGRPKKPKANQTETGSVNVNNPDGTHPVNSDNPDETGSKAKQEPRTKNQELEPETNNDKQENKKQEPGNISPPALSGKPDMGVQAKAAIDYLNLKIGSKYRHAESNLKLLMARLKEGHTLKDITDVIDIKVEEWPQGHPQFKYLRPATLFNAEKFNQYVGQVGMDVSGVGVDPVMAQREAVQRQRRIDLGIDPDPSEKTVSGEVLSEMTAIEYNQLLEH